MVQFQENARTDRRTDGKTEDGQTEGRTDRLHFLEPFRLPPGFQLPEVN